MPALIEIGQDAKKRLAAAVKRQINEQLLQKNVITAEMYEAAKSSLEREGQGSAEL